jgi:hypothetical protein
MDRLPLVPRPIRLKMLVHAVPEKRPIWGFYPLSDCCARQAVAVGNTRFSPPTCLMESLIGVMLCLNVVLCDYLVR